MFVMFKVKKIKQIKNYLKEEKNKRKDTFFKRDNKEQLLCKESSKKTKNKK